MSRKDMQELIRLLTDAGLLFGFVLLVALSR